MLVYMLLIACMSRRNASYKLVNAHVSLTRPYMLEALMLNLDKPAANSAHP
jgi:hypothetical protein